MGLMEQFNDAQTRAQEYLTFRLGGEEYGIDILKVQEIRGYDAVTSSSSSVRLTTTSSPW